jgi:hypothetical protein
MDFCKIPCCLDTGVGHDQRLADTHTLAFLAQHLHGAKVKLDLGHVIDKAMFACSVKRISCNLSEMLQRADSKP